MSKIQVLILAGGVGRRMWPIKKNKNLLPFFGKPLLEHQIESFQKAGFKNLMVVANSDVKKALKKKVKVIIQEKPLGQADAILKAEKAIVKTSPLLIANANDFFKPQLFTELQKRLQEKTDALLVGLETDRHLPMGYLVVKQGLVKNIVEKPKEGQEPSNIVRLVFDLFKEPQLLFRFLKQTKLTQDAYEKAMDRMIKRGVKFGLIKYTQSWGTIKKPSDVLKAREFFLQEKKKKDVVLGKGVKIFEGAVVKNSYIGDRVVIGNNALVRDSIIEAGCVVGYNTEVVRSYVGPNCWFHTNYIGDSVLEEDVSFGSGAKTANLRLDEKEVIPGFTKLGVICGRKVRVGINTSIMPGVKIGAGSFVGPGLILKDDLQEKRFCYLKQKLTIKKNLFAVDFQKRKVFRKNL